MMLVLRKLKLNTVVCGAFIIFSAFYLIFALRLKFWSSSYAPGPGFIPFFASSIMLVLSIIAFIQSFKQDGILLKEALPVEKVGRINLFVCWGCLLFYLFFVKKVGFIITSTIVLSALFSRGAKWSKSIIFALIVTIACFVVFKIALQVQIPTNKFGW